MKFSRRTTLILAIFAALFLLSQWLFIPKTYVDSRIIQALQAPKVLWQALKDRSAIVGQLSTLELENQSLRAQLHQAKTNPSLIKERGATYVVASVYSSYPLNSADRILVGAGSDAGLAVGDIVEVGQDIFLGTVVKVTAGASEVQTLFDPAVQIPVKIGGSRVDSLLVGGHQPKLTLISKRKLPNSGETVITASKPYPYGLTVGTVGDTTNSDRDLFSEAGLVTPYVLSDVSQVLIRVP